MSTKRSKESIELNRITNEIHIVPFDDYYNCSHFCKERCTCHCKFSLCKFLWNLLQIIGGLIARTVACGIMVGITLGVFYGGYLGVQEGIAVLNYADSLDIRGDCIITKAREEESSLSSSDSDDSSTYHYDFMVVYDNTTNADFPCENGTTDYQMAYIEVGQVGDIIDCYTNENCDDLQLDDINHDHFNAGWIFFGCALVFCYNLCSIIGTLTVGAAGIGFGCLKVFEFCRQTEYDCDIDCRCLCPCLEYNDWRNEKKHKRKFYYWDKWNGLAVWKQ